MAISLHESLTPVTFVAQPLDSVIPIYRALAERYLQRWGLECVLIDTHGQAVAAPFTCHEQCAGGEACLAIRRKAVEEAVRWGEPSVLLCPGGLMVWAVPVMENARVLGGLVVARPEDNSSVGDTAMLPPHDIRRAMFELLTMAEEANLTNAALLEMRRLAAQRESARAEAIHELKDQNYQSIRDIYLVEEPPLITAIKRGDRATAREILNRVLVGIYFMGRNRPLLLKSFILELVVMMSRTAVEAGGDPTELLGANYSSFAELARIDTEEELCAWLVSMLERIMDAIKAQHHYPVGVLLGMAMKYMQDHLQDELSRDEVAKVACLSPSHFSRMVKQAFGQSYTDLLSHLRVEKARELLVLTDKSLIQIGLESGFSDQSYFSKVFQKFTGRPPGEYRRLHRTTL